VNSAVTLLQDYFSKAVAGTAAAEREISIQAYYNSNGRIAVHRTMGGKLFVHTNLFEDLTAASLALESEHTNLFIDFHTHPNSNKVNRYPTYQDYRRSLAVTMLCRQYEPEFIVPPRFATANLKGDIFAYWFDLNYEQIEAIDKKFGELWNEIQLDCEKEFSRPTFIDSEGTTRTMTDFVLTEMLRTDKNFRKALFEEASVREFNLRTVSTEEFNKIFIPFETRGLPLVMRINPL
jgi:hypothetical protein